MESKILKMVLVALMMAFPVKVSALTINPSHSELGNGLNTIPQAQQTMLNQVNWVIDAFDDENKKLKDKENLSHCECQLDTRGGASKILNIYKSIDIRLFREVYESGVFTGATYFETKLVANFTKADSQKCVLVRNYDRGYEEFELYADRSFIRNYSCNFVVKTGCCCEVEEGQNSIKYYNCHATTITADESVAVCGAVMPVNNSGTCSPQYVVAKSGARTEKPETDISISADTLKERAKELNKVGTTSMTDMIGRAIKILMSFIGAILLALYIYAGVLWMLANGNEEKITSAKNILVWSTLGVAVMLGSYVIISTLFKELGL